MKLASIGPAKVRKDCIARLCRVRGKTQALLATVTPCVDDACRMVFTNRNLLALNYDCFPGGIFNSSLVQHAGAVWGIARCEKSVEALLDAEMLALREM